MRVVSQMYIAIDVLREIERWISGAGDSTRVLSTLQIHKLEHPLCPLLFAGPTALLNIPARSAVSYCDPSKMSVLETCFGRVEFLSARCASARYDFYRWDSTKASLCGPPPLPLPSCDFVCLRLQPSYKASQWL